jgi:PAT family beta-lactamase induction signal transducer AmpG
LPPIPGTPQGTPHPDSGVQVADEAPRTGWLQALRIYRQPKVLAMLFLGFSAGLPFMLVFSTLSAWLRDVGIERTTIGMLSWVGLVYTLKFFWAPVVDRVALPWLTALLGKRRGWMLLAQAGIAVALVQMALANPAAGSLQPIVFAALLLAFSSATQDIALDAWRIESAPVPMQGAMSAGYQLGYRLAVIAGSAGALWVAAEAGWSVAYLAMAVLAGVGIVTTLIVSEPVAAVARSAMEQEQRVVDFIARRAHWPPGLREAGAWFTGAVVCPLVDFFTRFGLKLAALILVLVGTYRMTDFTMGVMANPFYLDIGYSLKEIAAVAKFFSAFATIVGVLFAGVLVARLGALRSLALGLVLVVVTNLAFMTLALMTDPGRVALALVVSSDNFAMAIAGTALIAYLSSLTSAAYTATQYALFSSLYALPGKLLMGLSGAFVDNFGYPLFFVYTSALSVPALIMIVWLWRAAPAGLGWRWGMPAGAAARA